MTTPTILTNDIRAIRTEYDNLAKLPIAELRAMAKQTQRVSDVSDFRTKDHVITYLLICRHGQKRVSAAFA